MVRTWQIFCVGGVVIAEKQEVFISGIIETRESTTASLILVASLNMDFNTGDIGFCAHLSGSVAADKAFPRFSAGACGACHLNKPVRGAA